MSEVELNRLMQTLYGSRMPTMAVDQALSPDIIAYLNATGSPSVEEAARMNTMPASMIDQNINDEQYKLQFMRQNGGMPPYEEGMYSPQEISANQDQYYNYLKSIAGNRQGPRVGTDSTIGRLRAAEEMNRIRGLLNQ